MAMQTDGSQTPQVDTLKGEGEYLSANEQVGDVGCILLQLRDPLLPHVLETGRIHYREANQEDIRHGVRQGTETIIVLLWGKNTERAHEQVWGQFELVWRQKWSFLFFFLLCKGLQTHSNKSLKEYSSVFQHNLCNIYHICCVGVITPDNNFLFFPFTEKSIRNVFTPYSLTMEV